MEEEEIIGMVDAGVLGGDTSVKAPPTFDELKPGFELQHQRGGPIAGGYANQNDLKSLTKLTEKIDFYKVVPGQHNIVTYLFNEKAFRNAIQAGSTEETTMYTMVAVFCNKLTRDDAILSEMKAKTEYYTSFLHFMKEFKETKFPEANSILIRETEMCKQGKEEIVDYAQRWELLNRQVGWDPEKRIMQFIAGLRDVSVQERTNNQQFEKRDFKTIWKYASQLTCRDNDLTLNQGRRQRDAEIEKSLKLKPTAAVTAAATVSRSTTKSTPPKAKTTTSSASASTSSGRSAGAVITNRARLDENLPAATKEVKKLRLRGCYSCLYDHCYEDYDKCGNECVFCKKKFQSGGPRHHAISCNKRPSTREAMLKILDKYRNGGERK